MTDELRPATRPVPARPRTLPSVLAAFLLRTLRG